MTDNRIYTCCYFCQKQSFFHEFLVKLCMRELPVLVTFTGRLTAVIYCSCCTYFPVQLWKIAFPFLVLLTIQIALGGVSVGDLVEVSLKALRLQGTRG